MARAIELNHPPTLVAGLAFETSKTFQDGGKKNIIVSLLPGNSLKLLLHFFADLALATLDDKIVGKWRRYMKFKQSCYMAYVSCSEKLLYMYMIRSNLIMQ